MRKITKEAVRAFWNGKNYSNNNTHVIQEPVGPEKANFILHHNEIATLKRDGRLFINNCGWETSTTKERLNGILNGIDAHKYLGYLYQEKRIWYHSVLGGRKRTKFPCNEWVEIDLETGEIKL